MNKNHTYTLLYVNDAHSHMKSEVAKAICGMTLESYGVEFIHAPENEGNCQNSILKNEKKGKCNHYIKDEFVIQDNDTGDTFGVGNHCISYLVLNGYIINVNTETFQNILETLTIKNVCLICQTTCNTDTMHNTCLRGHSKRETKTFDKEQVKLKFKLKRDLDVYFDKKNFQDKLRYIKSLFKGSNYLNLQYSSVNMEKLNNILRTYRVIFENVNKINRLKNNCIIQSIRRQRRLPSEKQMIMVEKIINEYERIIKLDESNDNLKYKQYGYVY